MSGSGQVFRGMRHGLLAGICAAGLWSPDVSAASDGLRLAQAGMMSSQPRSGPAAPPSTPPAGPGGLSNRPAAPPATPAMPGLRPDVVQQGAGPSIVAPRPPASIVQPPAAASVAPAPAGAAEAAPSGPFAVAQTPEGYRASNLRFVAGPSTYVIPTAEIRGSSLSRDELSRLLDPASPASLAERVAGLRADEIVIPELRTETGIGPGRQSAVYRDIRLSGVASGRIEKATGGNGSFDGTSPDGPSRGAFARMDMGDIDAALMVSLLDKAPPGTSPELKRIYGSVAIESLTSEGPKGNRSRIARLAGRDFRARPTRDGWLATANAFAGHTDLNTAPPAERSRVVGAMVDLFEAFEVGALEATGIEFSDADKKETAGRISRIAYTGGGSPGEFRVEGFEAGGEDGGIRIANFSVGGISLSPMLSAARELAGKTAELTPAEIRRLVPVIGSVRMSGIEVNTKGDAPKGEAPMRITLASLELLADNLVDGVPTDLRLSLRNLSVPLEAAARNETARPLAALGYDKIDASLTANLGWEAPGQELVIRELSAEGAGMGRLLVRGVVGNLSKDAFSPDEALAVVAWMSATARSLEVIVQNAGLFEKLLAAQAAEKKRSVDELRREYGMMAAVAVPVMLGNSAAAKAVGQAVARFVAKPGRLVIEARARDAAGLGVADFAAAPDPTALLDKLDLSASAE
ncbi:hypothetical protein [Enterovirga sp. CN4-39]|uniref:hypothetical protein n=1 Tax=Enterovirga sp. CN4-39 TaxID=3400910 RepID=UPI003C0740A3